VTSPIVASVELEQLLETVFHAEISETPVLPKTEYIGGLHTTDPNSLRIDELRSRISLARPVPTSKLVSTRPWQDPPRTSTVEKDRVSLTEMTQQERKAMVAKLKQEAQHKLSKVFPSKPVTFSAVEK